MKILKFTVIIFALSILSIFLGSTVMGKRSIDFYKETVPKMDIKEYFDGPISAWGIVQDWRGRVVRRFDIQMIGKWEGDVGTLTEKFKYYDGEIQDRTWTIRKLGSGQYEGQAFDIIDKASGEEKGNAARWSYIMDLKVDDSTYRIHFDDWMWLMNDGVLINRSYLKKFGITVAELTIFMKKG
ncbi:MAG: DUF3833 domain-containing protein [Gammaproteobacteria bacterium]